MNKYIIAIFCILISTPLASLAIQTNVNKVTDLFDKHIEDKDKLLQSLELQNSAAISQIKSGKHHEAIEGMGGVKAKINELNSIKDTDLDNAGRIKRASKEYQFYDENELEPDYTKPGNRLHKKDSEDIVSATDSMMNKVGANFMDKLKSEGFNCKTVKGPVQKEPTYYIEIKREKQKNTDYDQFFCEELRNQYRCTDSVSLTCKKKGKKYGEWQSKKIKFSGITLHDHKMNWGYATKIARKHWRWMITPYHPINSGIYQVDSCWSTNPSAIIADVRAYIANDRKVDIEQIGKDITFPHHGGMGMGNITYGDRWRDIWDEYEFGYQYRDATDICAEWQEDWTERCVLK
jgi:hypothetical protein